VRPSHCRDIFPLSLSLSLSQWDRSPSDSVYRRVAVLPACRPNLTAAFFNRNTDFQSLRTRATLNRLSARVTSNTSSKVRGKLFPTVELSAGRPGPMRRCCASVTFVCGAGRLSWRVMYLCSDPGRVMSSGEIRDFNHYHLFTSPPLSRSLHPVPPTVDPDINRKKSRIYGT